MQILFANILLSFLCLYLKNFCTAFIWFWYKSNSRFITWVKEFFHLFYFFGRDCRTLMLTFLRCLVKLSGGPGLEISFLEVLILNYEFNIFNNFENESHSVLCDPLWPCGLYSPWIFFRPEYWSGQPFPSPGALPKPGIELRSPTLQVDSLPAEPPGKPKNTGVGSLSLFQWIFLTQELNRGLLHCRWILYQPS